MGFFSSIDKAARNSPLQRAKRDFEAGKIPLGGELPDDLRWRRGNGGFFDTLYGTYGIPDEKTGQVPQITGIVPDVKDSWFYDAFLPAAMTFGTAAIGGSALGGLGGGGGAAGGGISAAPLVPQTRNILAPLMSAGSSGAGATAGAGAMGTLGSILKKFDPTMLLLGGLSMLGGGDDDNLTSFKGTTADPVQVLTTLLRAIESMSTNIANRPAFKSSGFMPGPPSPISIPGVPFQIGGGMGVDPAAWQGEMTGPNPLPSPFGSQQATPRTVRRRNPFESGGR